MAKKQVNFKLPQDLIEALDTKARNENTNRTELVIQGIRYILGLSEVQGISIDSRIEKIENRLHNVETQCIDSSTEHYRIDLLEERINQLEVRSANAEISQRLQDLADQVEILTIKISQTRRLPNLSEEEEGTHSQTTSPKTVPSQLTLTELANRLGVDKSNLAKAKKNKTLEEFKAYTKQRDPEKVEWKFDETINAYQKVKNKAKPE